MPRHHHCIKNRFFIQRGWKFNPKVLARIVFREGVGFNNFMLNYPPDSRGARLIVEQGDELNCCCRNERFERKWISTVAAPVRPVRQLTGFPLLADVVFRTLRPRTSSTGFHIEPSMLLQEDPRRKNACFLQQPTFRGMEHTRRDLIVDPAACNMRVTRTWLRRACPNRNRPQIASAMWMLRQR